MKRYKTITLFVALALMAGTAVALNWFKAHQRLGRPGIQAEAIPDSVVMKIELPAKVLDFTSTNLPQSKTVLDYLPPDTSYASRYYEAPDHFWIAGNIILQGADRSSIHKPDYCLPGQGWRIDPEKKRRDTIAVAGPEPYSLPVSWWVGSRSVTLPSGVVQEERCLYVFWFVADREQTPSYDQRRNWIMRDLLFEGVLQRWAYVSYYTQCLPGNEDAAFERMKQFIAASVPEFQIPPPPAGAPVAVAR